MPLPLLIDLGLAFVAGVAAFFAAIWAAGTSRVPAAPALAPAREAGQALRSHERIRSFLQRRRDRSIASGFLLSLTALFAFGAGLALGVLAYLVRSFSPLERLDRSVSAWGFDHRSPLSTHGLDTITQFGNIELVVVPVIAIAVWDVVRTRNRWSAVFLLLVLVGMELISTGVKDLVARARPTLVPAAAHLGPSFPSGHSATAAATYAAAALVIGRRLAPGRRRALAAVAVGVPVAVAGSRVLLDLHWLSDVVGGLALGWGWFALCAAVFGGRLLRPTAAIETASAAATHRRPRRTAENH
jgi:undecaprenyl-diphosphatase